VTLNLNTRRIHDNIIATCFTPEYASGLTHYILGWKGFPGTITDGVTAANFFKSPFWNFVFSSADSLRCYKMLLFRHFVAFRNKLSTGKKCQILEHILPKYLNQKIGALVCINFISVNFCTNPII